MYAVGGAERLVCCTAMSAVSGQTSSNDGTTYNAYRQAGPAQSFCEKLVSFSFVNIGLANYFQLQLSHFLLDFYNFCTIGNSNEYFTTICNVLT